MARNVTGWFKPKQTVTGKQMSFLSDVFCGSCNMFSSVSSLGRPCPKCGASPESVVRASSWDFDDPKVKGLHLGKTHASEGVDNGK